MFSEYSRRKRHTARIYIRPKASANTSIRPVEFMNVNTHFQNVAEVVEQIEKDFKSTVKNTRNPQLGLIINASDFDYSVRYNGRVNSDNVTHETHRCLYTVSINKQRKSEQYGYSIYIYFIPFDEIESCEQKPMNFVATLKDAPPVVTRSVDRRVNNAQPAIKQLSKPSSTVVPKGCQLVYKIEAEQPYFVATLEEAEWLKKKQSLNFKEAFVANVLGVSYEVVGEARVQEVDTNDYTKNYIYKLKSSIPKGFKCQQYKVNGDETVYSNMLIDDAVEGVYDMVGKKNGMLIVVIHRSFLGDVREVIYTEDEAAMANYKDKYINRRKVS